MIDCFASIAFSLSLDAMCVEVISSFIIISSISLLVCDTGMMSGHTVVARCSDERMKVRTIHPIVGQFILSYRGASMQRPNVVSTIPT